MILVTGATGHFGKATIDFLLSKGVQASNIAALVRDKSKATDLSNKGIVLRIGDYDQYDSLVKAFTGVDRLLLVSGNDVVARLKQHTNAVHAAKEAGVQHILYTSFIRKNETATSPIALIAHSHIATEKLIQASGLNYTILKNSLYSDVLPMFLGEKVLETGVFLPAGNGKAAFTTRADMAEAAAILLAGTAALKKEYIIAGTELSGLNDVAIALSELTGKPVAYHSPAADQYTDTLVKAGVPAQYVGIFAGFSLAIEQGEFDTNAGELEAILQRKPTSLKAYLQSIYVH